MTLDEAIEQFKEDSKYNRDYLDFEYAEENEQVAKWLEELKFLRTVKETMYREIYNLALKDISDLIYQKAMIEDSDVQKLENGCWIRYKLFENCVEQLKKGAK